MEPKTITITLDTYEYLQSRDNILLALEGSGVDNWEGYDDAMESVG